MRRAGAALALALVVACGGGSGGDAGPTDSFDRNALLADLADNLLVPTYDRFLIRADALRGLVDAWCDALGGAGEVEARARARSSWRATMEQWQLAEAVLVGPAAMNDQDLRDKIYSWPSVNTCAVDQEVADYQAAPGSYDIATKLTNRRGLAALEYVLFTGSLDGTCPPQSAPPGWIDLGEAERTAARCGYAAAAAADVVVQAQVVVTAWADDGGDYRAELVDAGRGSSAFASAQEAVNAVSDAMFYLDVAVKDMKLAEPAGIAVNTCNTVQEPCPADLESRVADYSQEEIAANLLAFRRAFLGDGESATGIGFDDFLRALDAAAVADDMIADIAAAEAAVAAVTTPMSQALADDYADVVAAHAAVKAITDDLKSQFLTVLGLELPDAAAGDND